MDEWMQVAPQVAAALAAGQPCVALESTVFAHGLPSPHNIEVALKMEEIIRGHGATPATVGIMGGRVVVGLDRRQIEHLATGVGVRKVSRRDLPIVVAQQLDGATTVTTTAWAAHKAGLEVFATGGIGGVHRVSAPGEAVGQQGSSQGAPYPGTQFLGTQFLGTDISADLPELAQTPVMVICAGAKAILDLPATLEWLETHGVPVIGYRTDRFPAFFNRDSGLPVDVEAHTPEEVAAIWRAHRALGLSGGMLVTAPVPAEAELPQATMQAAISRALRLSVEQGIHGRELTPFLLTRVAEATGAASLRANLALLENNAHVAALIAVSLANQA